MRYGKYQESAALRHQATCMVLQARAIQKQQRGVDITAAGLQRLEAAVAMTPAEALPKMLEEISTPPAVKGMDSEMLDEPANTPLEAAEVLREKSEAISIDQTTQMLVEAKHTPAVAAKLVCERPIVAGKEYIAIGKKDVTTGRMKYYCPFAEGGGCQYKTEGSTNAEAINSHLRWHGQVKLECPNGLSCTAFSQGVPFRTPNAQVMGRHYQKEVALGVHVVKPVARNVQCKFTQS